MLMVELRATGPERRNEEEFHSCTEGPYGSREGMQEAVKEPVLNVL